MSAALRTYRSNGHDDGTFYVWSPDHSQWSIEFLSCLSIPPLKSVSFSYVCLLGDPLFVSPMRSSFRNQIGFMPPVGPATTLAVP